LVRKTSFRRLKEFISKSMQLIHACSDVIDRKNEFYFNVHSVDKCSDVIGQNKISLISKSMHLKHAVTQLAKIK
jgi:hypothetical protein